MRAIAKKYDTRSKQEIKENKFNMKNISKLSLNSINKLILDRSPIVERLENCQTRDHEARQVTGKIRKTTMGLHVQGLWALETLIRHDRTKKSRQSSVSRYDYIAKFGYGLRFACLRIHSN